MSVLPRKHDHAAAIKLQSFKLMQSSLRGAALCCAGVFRPTWDRNMTAIDIDFMKM